MKKLLILFSFFMIFSIQVFASKNLYLSYEKTPNSVYKNQKFEIKVKALITTSDFTNLTTNFVNQSNITVLNPNSSWKKYQTIHIQIVSILKQNQQTLKCQKLK